MLKREPNYSLDLKISKKYFYLITTPKGMNFFF